MRGLFDRKRLQRAMLLMLLISIIGLAGCGQSQQRASLPLVSANPVVFQTEKVKYGTVLEMYTALVSVQTESSYGCCFPYSGTIENIVVSENTTVKKGDVLATMAKPDLSNEIQEAQWEYDRIVAMNKGILDGNADKEQKDVARQQIDQAKAVIDRLRDQETNLELTAPFDGVITARWANSGMWVNPSDIVMTIGIPDKLVLVYQGNDYVDLSPYMKLDDEVLVSLNGELKSARVVAIKEYLTKEQLDADLGSENPISKRVLIRFDHPESGLSNGDTLPLTITSQKVENVLMIPNSAFVEEEITGVPYVYVLYEGFKLKRNVEIGAKGNDYTEIRSGLDEGEEVILN